MPTAQPDLQPLVAAQGQTRARLTDQAAAIAAAAAGGFTGWYSAEQITDWAAQLVKALQPFLLLLARNTDAYMARAVSQVSGSPFRPVGAIDVTGLRTGITQAGAYARAADAYRWQQSQWDAIARQLTQGGPAQPPAIIDPIEAAVQRVKDAADMDAILAVQQQSWQTMTAAEDKNLVTEWRRVIHPERSKGGTCGLCIVASDRVYRVRQLMPIHAEDKCEAVPISEGRDPGLVLNQIDLKRLYREAGSTKAADLKRTRYRVEHHGENGPMLVPAGQPLRAASRNDGPSSAKTAAEKLATVRKVLASQEAALPKARQLAAANPKWRPYLEKLEARIADLRQQAA